MTRDFQAARYLNIFSRLRALGLRGRVTVLYDCDAAEGHVHQTQAEAEACRVQREASGTWKE